MNNLFKDVPVFMAVVETGSFSAGARDLYLSRSAVGKAVARLEQRLGTRLFQRTTRSLNLTDDGHVFFEHCRQATALLKAGQGVIETGRNLVSGKLRITMPVLFGRLCVAPLLLTIASDYPDLALELDFRDQHVNLIESKIDLAIRNGPFSADPALESRHVARKRTLVCASPCYIKRFGKPCTVNELGEHKSIAYSRDGHIQAWQFSRDGETLYEFSPSSRLMMNDLGSMLDAVVAGQGMAWLPEWLVAAQLKQGELTELLPNVPSRLEDIHVIWPKAPYLTGRLRMVIKALEKGLSVSTVQSVY